MPRKVTKILRLWLVVLLAGTVLSYRLLTTVRWPEERSEFASVGLGFAVEAPRGWAPKEAADFVSFRPAPARVGGGVTSVGIDVRRLARSSPLDGRSLLDPSSVALDLPLNDLVAAGGVCSAVWAEPIDTCIGGRRGYCGASVVYDLDTADARYLVHVWARRRRQGIFLFSMPGPAELHRWMVPTLRSFRPSVHQAGSAVAGAAEADRVAPRGREVVEPGGAAHERRVRVVPRVAADGA